MPLTRWCPSTYAASGITVSFGAITEQELIDSWSNTCRMAVAFSQRILARLSPPRILMNSMSRALHALSVWRTLSITYSLSDTPTRPPDRPPTIPSRPLLREMLQVA